MQGLLNLYHVKSPENLGYDAYSDFVCASPSEDSARLMSPGGWGDWVQDEKKHLLIVTYIGIAAESIKEPVVVCASFHAG